jgi:hypothetical protein
VVPAQARPPSPGGRGGSPSLGGPGSRVRGGRVRPGAVPSPPPASPGPAARGKGGGGRGRGRGRGGVAASLVGGGSASSVRPPSTTSDGSDGEGLGGDDAALPRVVDAGAEGGGGGEFGEGPGRGQGGPHATGQHWAPQSTPPSHAGSAEADVSLGTLAALGEVEGAGSRRGVASQAGSGEDFEAAWQAVRGCCAEVALQLRCSARACPSRTTPSDPCRGCVCLPHPPTHTHISVVCACARLGVCPSARACRMVVCVWDLACAPMPDMCVWRSGARACVGWYPWMRVLSVAPRPRPPPPPHLTLHLLFSCLAGGF